jgi:predicted nucleic acid-binding protein
VTPADRLTDFLRRHRLVALDTSPFIYHLESHPRYGPAVAPVFERLERRGLTALTSTITMTELLVHPYRTGDLDRVNEIYARASTFPHLAWMPPTLAIADRAARLRADYRLRTPDALQAATALSAGAKGLIANDAALKRIAELEVLLLDELLRPDSPPGPADSGAKGSEPADAPRDADLGLSGVPHRPDGGHVHAAPAIGEAGVSSASATSVEAAPA